MADMVKWTGKGEPNRFGLKYPEPDGPETVLMVIIKERATEQRSDGWYVGDWTDGPAEPLADLEKLGITAEYLENLGECAWRWIRYGRKKLEDDTSSVSTGPEKVTAMKAVFDRLTAAEPAWNKPTERAPRYVVDETLVEAIVAVTKADRHAVRHVLKEERKETSEFLATAPKVAAKYAELKDAETKAVSLDLSSLAQ